eukprot:5654478-Ditylum_brightwellii.AAC.2
MAVARGRLLLPQVVVRQKNRYAAAVLQLCPVNHMPQLFPSEVYVLTAIAYSTWPDRLGDVGGMALMRNVLGGDWYGRLYPQGGIQPIASSFGRALYCCHRHSSFCHHCLSLAWTENVGLT